MRMNLRVAIGAASALLALLLPGYDMQAAETETVVITLSCEGKLTTHDSTSGRDHEPEPITKMGLLVNLRERTVIGLTVSTFLTARIDNIDAARMDSSGVSNEY